MIPLIKERAMSARRNLVLGAATAAAVVGGVTYLVRRAVIRTARVSSVSGAGPASASVVWTYSEGTRPLSVIIDLVAGSGASGSLTTDGGATSGSIPLAAPFTGAYTLTTTATYRTLGVPSTTVSKFAGVL
jgi:hypothetical protein